MSEKIVQIQVSPGDGDDSTDMIYALTDDGRVFVGEWGPHPDDPAAKDPDADPTMPSVFAWDAEPLPGLPKVSK